MIASNRLEAVRESSELLSLGMSVTLIILSAQLLALFWPAVKISWKLRGIDADVLLIIGIWVSFLGGAADNAYWYVTWLQDYLGRESANSWIAFGVIPNIFSRQGLGILAVWLHLSAHYKKRGGMKDTRANRLFTRAAMWGAASTAVLFAYKHI